MPATRPLEERFWEKVNKKGRKMPRMRTCCWEWTAAVDGCGYGTIGLGPGHTVCGKTHRISFAWARGGVPAGMCVLHRCDNPACVRPSHLFCGTQKDNAQDREKKGRSNHPRGDQHPSRTNPERLARGERHGNALLTNEDARTIRAEYTGRYGQQKELALRYHVGVLAIQRVLKRKTYAEA